jgi:hypothetical protein
MKTFLAVSLLAAFGTFSTVVGPSVAPATRPAAKVCSDCGCGGPEKDGSCGMEKGKTCQCKKSSVSQ